ncbi:pyridoxine 5'-phosphate synthase [Candidatus Liberibacter sp.]|uniref:pyridoxine 5'-phosphate synthase n=1 Tax=Candidatus Liberibacter sp. TaxID=34022 RepID=UPI0015F6E26E|nr:pyridoxine 5'-phosphate synthase [Candidatus Liberibacter sp.]MBA5724090.1 pyridoxine 5'-phosphate synthase [Candidatus Liberibacter sp.]
MPVKVSINLNAVAMLRNRRNLPWPNLIHIGRMSLKSGASGLTVHPRPDQRHIRFSDLPKIRQLIDDEFPGKELNIEGYPSEYFLMLCEKNKPDLVTLVPDSPEQATSDHGWDFVTNKTFLTETISRLHALGSQVSLFADGDGKITPLREAKLTGADRIELYTGPYGACYHDSAGEKVCLEKLSQTANMARKLFFEISAGHDLTIQNIPALIRKIPYISEISVGHAFAATAIEYGTMETIFRFRRACGQSF